MLLEFTTNELNALVQALGRRLFELREELAHTDDRQYRHELRQDLDRLEALEARLRTLAREHERASA